MLGHPRRLALTRELVACTALSYNGRAVCHCVCAVLCVPAPLSPVHAVCLTLLCVCLRVFISLLLPLLPPPLLPLPLPPPPPLLLLLLRAGTVATSGTFQSAVCTERPMVAGMHYVEMTLVKAGEYGAEMGVVGQGFDAAGGGSAGSSEEGWLLNTLTGRFRHANEDSDWEGMPRDPDSDWEQIHQGDVVGLLLDLGQRTLSVYLNGAWCGVMVAPGMKKQCVHPGVNGVPQRRGDVVAPLAGPLRWAVEVGELDGDGASVRIERRPVPGPVPSAEEREVAAVARNEATHEENDDDY